MNTEAREIADNKQKQIARNYIVAVLVSKNISL